MVVWAAFKLVVKVVEKPLLRLLRRKPPKPPPGPPKPEKQNEKHRLGRPLVLIQGFVLKNRKPMKIYENLRNT